MQTSRHYQRDDVARMRAHDGKASLVGLVTYVGENENNYQGEGCPDRGQRVGLGSIEAESPDSRV